jgi:hypothetical protein
MSRLLATVLVAAVAGVAVADVPPPPPPKGKKYVSVASEVKLAKDVSGYIFVSESSNNPGRPMFSYKKLDLSTDKAVPVSDGGRRAFASVVAVPVDAAKEFKTDADLFAAVEGNKIKGTHRLDLAGSATVPDTIKGESVKWTYTITAVDAKGVKATVEGDGYVPPKAKKEPKNDKEEEEGEPGAGNDPEFQSVANDFTNGGTRPYPLAAGVAAALALVFGGLWLAGRSRRKA